jgi:hypothetical protein
MLLRLVARPSDAKLPFPREAPFRDAPFRALLAVADVVRRFGAVVRFGAPVRFAAAVRLADAERLAVFVAGLAPVVLRWAAGLDFLVVAMVSPILVRDSLNFRATPVRAVSNRPVIPALVPRPDG